MTNRKLFVNLPVADLGRSVAFFTTLGFTFDPRFTDESATCMNIGEDAHAMLLVTDRFADFAVQPPAEGRSEALFCFSCESREEVDTLTDAALAAGGSPAKDPMDMGFMYARSFIDPDGHHWETMWMDPAAAQAGPEEFAERADGARA